MPHSQRPEVSLEIDREEFDAIVDRAVEGIPGAIDELRSALRKHPAIYQRLGDLAAHVQRTLAQQITGDSALAREALGLKIEEMRRHLRDGDVSPLEQLLVEEVVASWLDVTLQRIGFAQPRERSADSKVWEQRLDRAQKRHLAAVTALSGVQERAAGCTSSAAPGDGAAQYEEPVEQLRAENLESPPRGT